MIRKLLYRLNRTVPLLLAPVRLASGALARRVHATGIRDAMAKAELSAHADGVRRVLRALEPGDIEPLAAFLVLQQRDHFSYFRPHSFDRPALHRHLRASQFLSYGLFEDGVIIAYGIIRITPTRSAFIGSMVSQSHAGQGVGKLMARYLYWQVASMGLHAYLTISDDNPASLRSHSPDRTLEKVQSLNDAGYSLYRAPRVAEDDSPPELNYGSINPKRRSDP